MHAKTPLIGNHIGKQMKRGELRNPQKRRRDKPLVWGVNSLLTGQKKSPLKNTATSVGKLRTSRFGR